MTSRLVQEPDKRAQLDTAAFFSISSPKGGEGRGEGVGGSAKLHPGGSGATVGDSGVAPDGPDMGFSFITVRIASVQSVTNSEGPLPRFDKP